MSYILCLISFIIIVNPRPKFVLSLDINWSNLAKNRVRLLRQKNAETGTVIAFVENWSMAKIRQKMIGVEEVASSNLVAPTNKKKTGIRTVSGFPNFFIFNFNLDNLFTILFRLYLKSLWRTKFRTFFVRNYAWLLMEVMKIAGAVKI